jgi:hypothetical protein
LKRPVITFDRLNVKALRPELFPATDATYTICSTVAIFSTRRCYEVMTGIGVRIPQHYSLMVDAHPFAKRKGLVVTSLHPITHLHTGQIRMVSWNLALERPQLGQRQLLIAEGQPLALLTLVRTPISVTRFEGWEQEKVEDWI